MIRKCDAPATRALAIKSRSLMTQGLATHLPGIARPQEHGDDGDHRRQARSERRDGDKDQGDQNDGQAK